LVSEAKGRLFKRKDGKYLVYLPVYLCEDSMFPFKTFEEGPRGGCHGIPVKVYFTNGANPKIIVEPWK